MPIVGGRSMAVRLIVEMAHVLKVMKTILLDLLLKHQDQIHYKICRQLITITIAIQ